MTPVDWDGRRVAEWGPQRVDPEPAIALRYEGEIPQPPPGVPVLAWLGDELWAIARCEPDSGMKFLATLNAHWPVPAPASGEETTDA